MDRKTWRVVMSAVWAACREGWDPMRARQYPLRQAVAMYLWAAWRGRNLTWACDPGHDGRRFRPRKLPSLSQFSRRLRTGAAQAVCRGCTSGCGRAGRPARRATSTDFGELSRAATEVFLLDTLIGTMPAAVIFQAAFCFVAYDATRAIKAYGAGGAGRPGASRPASRSTTWPSRCGPRRQWPRRRPPVAVAARPRERLSGAWRDWWINCPTTRRDPAEPTRYAKGGRASVHRLLRDGVEPHTRPLRKRPAAGKTIAERTTTTRHT